MILINLQSGVQQLTIHGYLGVLGVRVIEGTIVVIDRGGVAIWFGTCAGEIADLVYPGNMTPRWASPGIPTLLWTIAGILTVR